MNVYAPKANTILRPVKHPLQGDSGIIETKNVRASQTCSSSQDSLHTKVMENVKENILR